MNIRVRNTHYPVFQIKSSVDNYGLLLKIAKSLNAFNCVHKYKHGKQTYSILIIRDRQTILETLIPLLNDRIEGEKKTKFFVWRDEFLKNCSTWNYREIKNTKNIQIDDEPKEE